MARGIPILARQLAGAADVIPVAGVAPLTTLDFPERLATVVFTQGCPWRCAYCHNARLRSLDQPGRWHWQDVCALLDDRRGFVEAVVFSGGEPTLHPGLEIAIRAVRRKRLLVGLHTAGIFPGRLCALLPLLDWVGLDVKTTLDDDYARLTGDAQSAAKVEAALKMLKTSGIPFQLRTTVADGADGDRMFAEVRECLIGLGAGAPVRQSMREIAGKGPA